MDPEAYVTRLDLTGAHPVHRALAARSLELLRLRPGASVLEVGCGTGSHVLEAAARVAPNGQAIGLDRSCVMIETCQRRSARETLLPARFVQADATRLPFEDEVFDGCRALRTLLHLGAAPTAVAEMARVTRRGGRVVLVEPDYGSTQIEGPDPKLTRPMVAARVAHFAQGRAGLWMAAWALKAGLRVEAQESLWLEQGWTAQREERYQRKYADAAVAMGSVEAAAATLWMEQLREAAARGCYRHRVSLRLVAAVRP